MTSCQFFIKYFCLASVALLIGSAASAQTGSPAKSFEGLMQLQVQDWQSVEIMNYHAKGVKVRMESSLNTSASTYFIIDNLSKKIFVVMPARDSYMEGSLEKPVQEKPFADADTELMTKTDESKTILGYPCEHWILKEGDITTDIWATKALGTGSFADLTLSSETQASFRWEDELKARGLFPLRLTQQDSNGTDVYKLVILKIQRKVVNEGMFRIPEGYEKIESPLSKKPANK